MPNQQKQRSAGTDDLPHILRRDLSCAVEFGVNTGGNRRDRTVCQRLDKTAAVFGLSV